MIFSLITNLEHLDVILASASPRRFELLNSTGLRFKVVPSNFDENEIVQTDPVLFVQEAAFKKGQTVAQKYDRHLVISADTIVVLDNSILGKPKDEPDAKRMLSLLSGRQHRVLTAFGLFLFKYDKSEIQTVSTDVVFRQLSEDEIDAYINTGEPMDKAGAYAIQGQGAMLIDKINGSYSNVVGFPLSQFYTVLDRFLAGFAL